MQRGRLVSEAERTSELVSVLLTRSGAHDVCDGTEETARGK